MKRIDLKAKNSNEVSLTKTTPANASANALGNALGNASTNAQANAQANASPKPTSAPQQLPLSPAKNVFPSPAAKVTVNDDDEQQNNSINVTHLITTKPRTASNLPLEEKT